MSQYLAQFVNILTWTLTIALLGRVVLSWLNLESNNPLVTAVYQITEPILAPIRKVLPTFGMLDFSPVVAIILVRLVNTVFSRLV